MLLAQIEPSQSRFSCDATCSTSALLEASSYSLPPLPLRWYW
jgi:hypothetical protein